MIEQDRVVKRGDVYYADLSDRKGSLQKGIRPVVITQSDHLNRYSTTYIGAAITSILKKKDATYHVVLPMIEGLPKRSMVLAEQRWTFDRSELIEYRCTLNEQLMTQIKNACDAAEKAEIRYRHRKRPSSKKKINKQKSDKYKG